MSEFTDILTHGRRLKAAVKELTIAELEAVYAKLENVIEQRREEEKAALQQAEEKQRKVAELKAAMAAAGIDVADLTGQAEPTKTKRKRAPKPAKYAITNAQGERITWTGQGRMPKALKVAVDNGKPLTAFLI